MTASALVATLELAARLLGGVPVIGKPLKGAAVEAAAWHERRRQLEAGVGKKSKARDDWWKEAP